MGCRRQAVPPLQARSVARHPSVQIVWLNSKFSSELLERNHVGEAVVASLPRGALGVVLLDHLVRLGEQGLAFRFLSGAAVVLLVRFLV